MTGWGRGLGTAELAKNAPVRGALFDCGRGLEAGGLALLAKGDAVGIADRRAVLGGGDGRELGTVARRDLSLGRRGRLARGRSRG